MVVESDYLIRATTLGKLCRNIILHVRKSLFFNNRNIFNQTEKVQMANFLPEKLRCREIKDYLLFCELFNLLYLYIMAHIRNFSNQLMANTKPISLPRKNFLLGKFLLNCNNSSNNKQVFFFKVPIIIRVWPRKIRSRGFLKKSANTTWLNMCKQEKELKKCIWNQRHGSHIRQMQGKEMEWIKTTVYQGTNFSVLIQTVSLI